MVVIKDWKILVAREDGQGIPARQIHIQPEGLGDDPVVRRCRKNRGCIEIDDLDAVIDELFRKTAQLFVVLAILLEIGQEVITIVDDADDKQRYHEREYPALLDV